MKTTIAHTELTKLATDYALDPPIDWQGDGVPRDACDETLRSLDDVWPEEDFAGAKRDELQRHFERIYHAAVAIVRSATAAYCDASDRGVMNMEAEAYDCAYAWCGNADGWQYHLYREAFLRKVQ